MKLYHSSKTFPQNISNPVIALGNFDGVHRAHQTMFALASKLAKKIKGHAIVYTFEPHPVRVLSKTIAPPLINTLAQKLELLATQPLNATVVEPFNRKFAALSAKKWFEEVLVKRLRVKAIVVGYDFTFGRNREGTVSLLESLSQQHNMELTVLPAQLFRGTLISSTQIREYVRTGQVKAASDLLGRAFFIEGQVVAGIGRGKTIGIPTANLQTENELLPARGVYVSFSEVRTGKLVHRYGSVTNVGFNPTFGGETLSVETHLFNFKQNIYGKKIKIEFLKRLRDEKIFGSPKQLVQQIEKDIAKAKKILANLK